MKRWRLIELGLLVFPALLLLVGEAWLGAVRTGRAWSGGLAMGGVLAALLLAGHCWLCWRLPGADQVLLPTAAGLAVIGLIVVSRLEPALGVRQAIWVVVGLAAMGGATALLPRVGWLRQYRYSLAGLGLGGVLATLVFGIDPNGSGARLWVGFGGLYFQPSELLKILLVVFFAAYLEDHRELLTYGGPRLGPWRLPPLPYLAPLAIMFGLSQLLLVAQHDLGAALLFYGIFLSMLYVASGRWSFVLLGAVLFVAGSALAYLAVDHVRERVTVWLNPWEQAETGGYQLIQALYALGAGGLFGVGLGRGVPAYIPAVQTDYIIAAIGEELGLAGTLAIVGLYVLLVGRGLRVALERVDGFQCLLAAGLTSVIAIQALVILGGTLRLMPLTGVTLPLVSYGGSSILANFILLGLLLRLSAEPVSARHAG